jgi:hypothetical protein
MGPSHSEYSSTDEGHSGRNDKMKILNVIILVPPDNGEHEMNVYTWVSYQPLSGERGNFVDVVPLDKWININGGYFSRNASLYQ